MASLQTVIPTENARTPTASIPTPYTPAPQSSNPTASTPTDSMPADSTPTASKQSYSIPPESKLKESTSTHSTPMTALTPTGSTVSRLEAPPSSSAKSLLLPPRSCPDPSCNYNTPEGLFSEQLTDIQLHVRFSHPEPSTSSRTPQELVRPQVEENIAENDWRVFIDEWRRYKRSCLSQATVQIVADQLTSCCSKALRHSILGQSRLRALFKNNTNEKTILEAIREVAVKNIPKNVDDFLCMNQLPNESIENYAARLNSASLSCNFELPAGQTNYREQMIKHQLINGLVDNEVRIHTIQTISKKKQISLGETLNVIKIKESSSEPKIKGEYIEETDTTQTDIKIETETLNPKSNSNDQSQQPPSPTTFSVPMIVSPPNHINNQDEVGNTNLLLPPPSPTPSTVSTIPFSPCHSQEVQENQNYLTREENDGLKERVRILEESLAGNVDMTRRMKEKHETEIIILELQLKLKSEEVERMIYVAQKDSRKYEKQINDLQENKKDCKLKSESMKKEILMMHEERTKAQSDMREVLSEKEKLEATLQNNQEYQLHIQQEHNEDMEKIESISIKMQTKLEKSTEKNNFLEGKLNNADVEIRNLKESNDYIDEQLSNANCEIRDLEENNENINEQLRNANCEIRNLQENKENIRQRGFELFEKNKHLETVNKSLRKRMLPIQKINSKKRKIQEHAHKVVIKKRKLFKDDHGNPLYYNLDSETSSDEW